eukprot:904750-Pleurochrysis_carterae.AAC.1
MSSLSSQLSAVAGCAEPLSSLSSQRRRRCLHSAAVAVFTAPLSPLPSQRHSAGCTTPSSHCLLYTSDAADDTPCVDL